MCIASYSDRLTSGQVAEVAGRFGNPPSLDLTAFRQAMQERARDRSGRLGFARVFLEKVVGLALASRKSNRNPLPFYICFLYLGEAIDTFVSWPLTMSTVVVFFGVPSKSGDRRRQVSLASLNVGCWCSGNPPHATLSCWFGNPPSTTKPPRGI